MASPAAVLSVLVADYKRRTRNLAAIREITSRIRTSASVTCPNATMTDPDTIPELEPGLYESCPDCPDDEGFCLTCYDSGLVPHENCGVTYGPGMPD